MMLAICLPVSLALSAFGSAIAMGRAITAAFESSARQPEIAGKILQHMIIGCALIEMLTLYVLVFAFTMYGKL